MLGVKASSELAVDAAVIIDESDGEGELKNDSIVLEDLWYTQENRRPI
jgi:hypothetical protein